MMGSATVPKGAPGPLLGTIWWVLTVSIVAYIASCIDCTAYHLLIGYRSAIALMGYLIMQIGLWNAELRWDEMGSKAYLEAAAKKVNNKSIIELVLTDKSLYWMPTELNLSHLHELSVAD